MGGVQLLPTSLTIHLLPCEMSQDTGKGRTWDELRNLSVQGVMGSELTWGPGERRRLPAEPSMPLLPAELEPMGTPVMCAQSLAMET